MPAGVPRVTSVIWLRLAGLPSLVAAPQRLVDGMTQRFDPSKFKDSYHDDLMARIEEKIKKRETHEITAPGKEGKDEPRSAQVIDLADLLKQSLGKGGKKATEKRAAAAPARGKSSLRVVAGGRGAAKAVAKRKRA